mmetsp:Transcript_46619/g.111040  ORF Transcript_46619/g.111040 Transcript_46619/m.111040 type:complete len:583 (+) Transcript_46619:1105-2853(+)
MRLLLLHPRRDRCLHRGGQLVGGGQRARACPARRRGRAPLLEHVSVDEDGAVSPCERGVGSHARLALGTLPLLGRHHLLEARPLPRPRLPRQRAAHSLLGPGVARASAREERPPGLLGRGLPVALLRRAAHAHRAAARHRAHRPARVHSRRRRRRRGRVLVDARGEALLDGGEPVADRVPNGLELLDAQHLGELLVLPRLPDRHAAAVQHAVERVSLLRRGREQVVVRAPRGGGGASALGAHVDGIEHVERRHAVARPRRVALLAAHGVPRQLELDEPREPCERVQLVDPPDLVISQIKKLEPWEAMRDGVRGGREGVPRGVELEELRHADEALEVRDEVVVEAEHLQGPAVLERIDGSQLVRREIQLAQAPERREALHRRDLVEGEVEALHLPHEPQALDARDVVLAHVEVGELDVGLEVAEARDGVAVEAEVAESLLRRERPAPDVLDSVHLYVQRLEGRELLEPRQPLDLVAREAQVPQLVQRIHPLDHADAVEGEVEGAQEVALVEGAHTRDALPREVKRHQLPVVDHPRLQHRVFDHGRIDLRALAIIDLQPSALFLEEASSPAGSQPPDIQPSGRC